MLISLGHALPVGEPTALGISAVVPERIAVVATAPLGVAVVVVEDHHDPGCSKSSDDLIEDSESVLALHARVRGKRVVGDDGVRFIHLARPWEPHSVEVETLNAGNDTCERLQFQPGDNEISGFCSVLIEGMENHAAALAVHDVGPDTCKGNTGAVVVGGAVLEVVAVEL
jgi:hypothetical protein